MKRNNNIAPFFIIFIVFILFSVVMKSNSFTLLFLVPFAFPLIIILTIFIFFKFFKKASKNVRPGEEYYNNSKRKAGQGEELVTLIKNSFEKHKDNTASVQDNKKSEYSYQDKPEEDYCDGSERSCDLINKEEPIAITSVLDDSDVNFETRLNRLSEDMDNAGCYNLASKDEMKKAVIYSEIINKKY